MSVHPRGFGFLDTPSGSSFVPPGELSGFLGGDLVSAEVRTEKDGRTSARSLRLVERSREELFGTVGRRGRKTVLELDPAVSAEPWPLSKAPRDLAAGAAVLARVRGQRAEWLRTVPPGEAPLLKVLTDHRLRDEHPPEVLAAARRRRRPPSQGRRDLRSVFTLTIDGPTTRDLDDALAVLPPQRDGAVRVLVHIADVDALVPAGSPLDREARARGTSVYFPDRVVPMLPFELSEGALSLLEGEDRAALTAELRIDPEGDVTAVDLYPSRVTNHARLTYADVASFLDQGCAEAVPAEAHEPLRWLRTAAARLSATRGARGGVTTFSREEFVLRLEDGEPVALEAQEETCAHRLIERLMVAANEAVARWLFDRGLPALYRSMPEPTPERLRALDEVARHFGFEAGFGARLGPRGMAAFEEQFRTSHVAPALRSVVRRALGRALYSPQPAPHFALAAPLYLHFTSPIRRYADLVVHRIVKAHLRGERRQDPDAPELAELAQHLNDAAARAKKAEFARRDQLVARLYTQRLGERAWGDVIAVHSWGLLVQLRETGAVGSVAMDDLPGGPFRLEEAHETLAGRRRSYAVGDALEVEVRAADPDAGRIALAPAPARRRR
ncbi:MAG: RNB domain-containing ribonuclease [Planctomycetota bacterium]|nr:MAG: RNB domain-containing ribonuclease [Planctomycetota bacterium]